MTNGAPEWVALLKQALAATGHYKHVASSRDLVLSWEQKYVAQAMDMLVGQRAQVFIGNGVSCPTLLQAQQKKEIDSRLASQWSSLTGGIVVMRTANRFHPDTTRFF